MLKSNSIAYLCTKRQLHIIDENGVSHLKSQQSGPVQMAWWAALEAKGSHAWPTWSPDGKTIASFHCDSTDRVSRVVLAEADGICSEELAVLEDRLPIYLQWSSNADAIAVLCQREEQLQLSCVRPGQIGAEYHQRLGSPMFFTWAGDRIALFVGMDEQQPQLQVIDPFNPSEPLIYPHVPGNFCAPLWVNQTVVYVATSASTGPMIYAADLKGEHRELQPVRGLTALVASPDGRTIACATAEGGDGTPYQGLSLLDLKTGTSRKISQKSCMAFVWSPTGDSLVLAHVNTERNLLEWYRVSLEGEVTHLIDLHPTRDLGFYLRFFEQYCQSHRLIDSKGENLIVAGTIPNHPESTDTPAIWNVPFDGTPPKRITDGMFAVFAPTQTSPQADH